MKMAFARNADIRSKTDWLSQALDLSACGSFFAAFYLEKLFTLNPFYGNIDKAGKCVPGQYCDVGAKGLLARVSYYI